MQIRNPQPIKDVLMVERLDFKLNHVVKAEVDKNVMSQNVTTIRSDLARDLKGMDHCLKRRPIPASLRSPVEFDPEHLRVMERWPVAVHGNQLLGASDAVRNIHRFEAELCFNLLQPVNVHQLGERVSLTPLS